MKIKTTGKNSLFEEGKANWESTDDFNRKINDIRRDLSEKYSPLILAEKNWFMRLLIKICRWRDMKEKIDELSSLKNLHFCAQ